MAKKYNAPDVERELTDGDIQRAISLVTRIGPGVFLSMSKVFSESSNELDMIRSHELAQISVILLSAAARRNGEKKRGK